MAGTCATCGKAIKGEQRFCPGCGSPVLLAAGPPIEADPAPTGPAGRMSARTRSLLLGAWVAAAIGAVVSLGMFLSRDESDPALTQPEATVAASEDPNAPRPQAWFDSYQDKFLSAELDRLTLASATKRSFPTAKGSQTLGEVPRGTMLKGRWVEGGDPKTRWLKLADGSYVWEGNLTDPTQINPLGMNGFVAGTRFTSVEGRLDTTNHESYSELVDEGSSCDQYASADGLVTVMLIDNKVSRVETDSERFETSKGIHVGSTEAELKRAYGAALKREPEHYGEGWDYYMWSSKDRGIRFIVSEGKVSWITSGDETIRYIEGCA